LCCVCVCEDAVSCRSGVLLVGIQERPLPLSFDDTESQSIALSHMLTQQPTITTSAWPMGRRHLARTRLLTRSTSTRTSTRSGARRRAAQPRATAADAAAADALGAAAAAPPAKTTPTLLALKEWAVTIDALLSGDQILLLRKGGLLDGKFRLEARDFLLFPTTFHATDPLLLAPGAAKKFARALALPEPKLLVGAVPLKCRARVEAAWSTADGGVVEALAHEGLHVWGEKFTEARLKWRPGAPMTLALVRAEALVRRRRRGGQEGEEEAVMSVRQSPEYYGCFSWARVEPVEAEGEGEAGRGGAEAAEQADARWRPVLSDEEFARREARVRAALAAAGIEATPIELP
jgi:hypothetical protein